MSFSPDHHENEFDDFGLQSPINKIEEDEDENNQIKWDSKSSFSSQEFLHNEKTHGKTQVDHGDILNMVQIVEDETKKTKKMFIFALNLDNYYHHTFAKNGFHFLKKLKRIFDEKCHFKLAFDKMHKIFRGLECEYQKLFFSNFLSKFATKKRLFEFNCYQKINQIRFPVHKTSKYLSPSPNKRYEKCGIKFKLIYKLYKDHLGDLTYKQKLLTENDLKYFLSMQTSCFSIFSIIFSHQRNQLRTAFKNIMFRALISISPEEMTGCKGFSKYSIILLPFKDKFNFIKKTEIITLPNNDSLHTPIKPKIQKSGNKSKLNSVSPISVNLMTHRVLKIGELSENAYSKFYENSIYMSPDQRIDRYHRKLNSLSKIVEKKFPNIKSRQLDRFVLYEHGIMQVFRVVDNGILRKKMFSFKEIKFCMIYKNKKRSCVINVLNIYRKHRGHCLLKFLNKWKVANNKNECILLKYKKIHNIFMDKKFEELKDSFIKIRVFTLKKKIEGLLHSNWMQFQKEEKLVEEEIYLKTKIATLMFVYILDKRVQHQNSRSLNSAFYKILSHTSNLTRIAKSFKNLFALIMKKEKSFVFHKIEDFSKRKLILFQMMNSIKAKTLIKSFWTLKHWKASHDEEDSKERNKFKFLYFIEKIKKICLKPKKMLFEIMRNQKNDFSTFQYVSTFKNLNLFLNKKTNDIKREVLYELLGQTKEFYNQIRIKIQNSIFLSKILQLIFRRRKQEILKNVFENFKIPKKDNQKSLSSMRLKLDKCLNIRKKNDFTSLIKAFEIWKQKSKIPVVITNTNFGKIKKSKYNKNNSNASNTNSNSQLAEELSNNIRNQKNNESENTCSKDKSYNKYIQTDILNNKQQNIDQNFDFATKSETNYKDLPGIQPVHSIAILRKNIIHKNNCNENNNNLLKTPEKQENVMISNYYSKETKDYVYESKNRYNKDYQNECQEVLPSRLLHSQNLNDNSGFNEKHDKSANTFLNLQNIKNKQIINEKNEQPISENNKSKLTTTRVYQNPIEEDISRILKDEDFHDHEIYERNSNCASKQIIGESKKTIKNFYYNLFSEVLDEKKNLEKTVKRTKGNYSLHQNINYMNGSEERNKVEEIKYLLSPFKFPLDKDNEHKENLQTFSRNNHDFNKDIIKSDREVEENLEILMPKKLLQPIFFNEDNNNVIY